MSNLDFVIQSTPYSSYITVRRKFQKNAFTDNISLNVDRKETEDSDVLIDLRAKNEVLEKENMLLQSQSKVLLKDHQGKTEALEKENRLLQSQSEDLQK